MIAARQVIDIVGHILHRAGAGYWTGADGDPVGAPPGVPPVFAKRLPAKPTVALAVNVYGLTHPASPALAGQVEARVQVRARAPIDADPTADNALRALHAAHHQEWAGIQVDRITHESTAQLGLDAAGSDERTDNYTITLHS